jgi:type I restriction enzyme S subunit
VNVLPTGWRWVTPDEVTGGRRSNLVIGPFGSNLKVSDYQDSGIPLIFVRNIRSRDFVAAATRFISEKKAQELQAHEVRSGDVLITKMGDPPGDSCVYTGGTTAIITADCIRLRPTDDFHPRFISLAFESPVIRSQVLQITRGVAQKKVSLSRLRSGITIPAPSLSEQEHIIEVLDGYLSRLDAANILAGIAERRLHAWQRASLDSLVRGDADGTIRLRCLIDRVETGRSYGGSAPPAALDEWGIIKVSAMTWGEFRQGQNKAVPNDRVDPRYEIHTGDLLVSRANTTAYVGAPVLVEKTRPCLLLSDKSLRLVPKSGIDVRWLAAALAAPTTRSQISALATGTKDSMRNISQRNLLSVRVPYATLEQQERVAAHVSTLRRNGRHLGDQLTVARARSLALRRALLTVAFSGRLSRLSIDAGMIEEMAGA